MKTISIEELKKKMDTHSEITLLDVREPDERNDFNIGGIFIPLNQIMSFQFDEIDHLKDKEVYVYCRSGMRSMQACMFLEQAGFKDISNIQGGILAWQEFTK